MLIGYMRVSKADGSQSTNLQRDALLSAGVDPSNLYEDHASGKKDDRPELAACLKGMRAGDTLLVWKLDRLGGDLRHLVNTVHNLTERGIGLKVLTGEGAAIDTTRASGKLVFGIFAALTVQGSFRGDGIFHYLSGCHRLSGFLGGEAAGGVGAGVEPGVVVD
jgi:DNA invertase Pin-like site-specific DNA recombinase